MGCCDKSIYLAWSHSDLQRHYNPLQLLESWAFVLKAVSPGFGSNYLAMALFWLEHSFRFYTQEVAAFLTYKEVTNIKCFFEQDYIDKSPEHVQDSRISALKEGKPKLFLEKRRVKEYSNLSMIIFLNLLLHLNNLGIASEFKIVPKSLQWKVGHFLTVSSGWFEAGSYKLAEANF